jgi:hypothetical protein
MRNLSSPCGGNRQFATELSVFAGSRELPTRNRARPRYRFCPSRIIYIKPFPLTRADHINSPQPDPEHQEYDIIANHTKMTVSDKPGQITVTPLSIPDSAVTFGAEVHNANLNQISGMSRIFNLTTTYLMHSRC